MQQSQTWTSRLHFILATSGAAIGLGTVWAAPFTIGQNGGGSCFLMYVILTFLVGLPILHVEIMLGSRSRKNILSGIKYICSEERISQNWGLIGYASMLLLICILSFYVIVGGKVLAFLINYILKALFNLSYHPNNMLYDFIMSQCFCLLTLAMCVNSIRQGVERCVKYLMPLLFLSLIGLLLLCHDLSGFRPAITYLFHFDSSYSMIRSMLAAMGLSFFTLATGAGCMMNYGAYLKSSKGIFPINFITAVMIVVAVCLSGILVFTVTFTQGIPPSQGHELVFNAIPFALSKFGSFADISGAVFFFLILLAALTSSISLLEPLLRVSDEQFNIPRLNAGIVCIIILFFTSILYIVSTHEKWGINIFNLVTQTIIEQALPFMALMYLFFGIRSNTSLTDPSAARPLYYYIMITTRFISPLALIVLIGSKLWS
tara:strand:+ start:920 stop:2212 length:1293 start_codon:yes stop_codon:yes gene_type:complete